MSLSRPLLLLAFSVFVLQVSDQPNKLIEHPEQFGGAWETTTVSGIDGIFIQIQADTHQAPLRSGQSVDIWLYHRERGEQTGGWANVVTYDSNAASGAVASNHSDTFFDGTRLHIGFAGHGDQKPVDLPFDLDVTYSPSSQQWTGIWTRSDESRSVTLERPKPSGGVSPTVYVGDWMLDAPESPTRGPADSIHIRQSSDGALSAWFDSARKLGDDVDSEEIAAGQLLRVLSASDAELLLETNHATGTNNRYCAAISSDHRHLIGDWMWGGDASTRVHGNFYRSP